MSKNNIEVWYDFKNCSHYIYNPVIHTEGTDPDSSVLLFEGTYTASFADRPPKTPRWDYTQVLYRLDLDDPRLTGQ